MPLMICMSCGNDTLYKAEKRPVFCQFCGNAFGVGTAAAKPKPTTGQPRRPERVSKRKREEREEEYEYEDEGSEYSLSDLDLSPLKIDIGGKPRRVVIDQFLPKDK